MTNLNNQALEIIKKIKEEKNNLNMSWKGNANEGFNNTMDSIILDCEKAHLDMKEVENMLKEITNVYEKE